MPDRLTEHQRWILEQVRADGRLANGWARDLVEMIDQLQTAEQSAALKAVLSAARLVVEWNITEGSRGPMDDMLTFAVQQYDREGP